MTSLFKGTFEELAEHRAKNDLNLNFINIKLQTNKIPPSLYFNFVEEGVLLYQKDSSYLLWKKKVIEIMKRINAKFIEGPGGGTWNM